MPIQYEVVKEVEEEFDDGGVRELDNYFGGTKLAFVDYIQPRAIVQKGFKKMALAIVPGCSKNGKGTRDWTAEEIQELLQNGKVRIRRTAYEVY